jgi:ubiquinone/menaquinone biosynthesis C-methylase UbiE
MPYIGEPFDASYFKGTRPEGYTDYDDHNPAIWVNIVDDIEDQIGLVSGIKTLDIGCAFGYLSNELASRGALVESIDISTYALNEAQTRFPSLSYTQVDTTQLLPWGNNFFRLVVATMITECMNNETEVDQLLNQANRVLHPQGSAYILGADHDRGDGYWWKLASEWEGKVIGGRDVVAEQVGHILPADVRVVIS